MHTQSPLNMTRKQIAYYTLLIFAMVTLTNCGSSVSTTLTRQPSETTTTPPILLPTSTPFSTQTSQQKIISVWTHNLPGDAEGEALAAAVKEFERTQDNYRIEIVSIAGENYPNRVISSALSGSLPCVLEFDGPYLYNFAWLGYLKPIDHFVSPEMKADFLPSILAQGTFNGQLYSLGQFDSGLAPIVSI